jgi:hypothetical protein
MEGPAAVNATSAWEYTGRRRIDTAWSMVRVQRARGSGGAIGDAGFGRDGCLGAKKIGMAGLVGKRTWTSLQNSDHVT